MRFHLYKLSGYEEAIMSLRMSHGKFFSWEKAQEIQDLAYAVTNKRGEIANEFNYRIKLQELDFSHLFNNHGKLTGNYEKDVAEFERLLGKTMNNAMGQFDHHTLMKYIDISFFTIALHRGAQDDLDAHAMGFNNRITRFSTRLAEIPEPKLSEWYADKVMSFHDAHKLILTKTIEETDDEIDIELAEALEKLRDYVKDENSGYADGTMMPLEIVMENGDVFKYSPFGYILEKYADMAKNNGLFKDVQRGLIPIGQEGPALWKTDLFNLRYIYFRRSKLTKANPELKQGIEMLADQIEASLPVFGKYFRLELTDSGTWEHMNKIRTVTKDEYETLMRWKNAHCETEEESRG